MLKLIQYISYTACILILASSSLFAQGCEDVIGEKSGQFIETGACKDGLRDGTWYFLYDRTGAPESRAKAKGDYKNGKKQGEWYFYRETNADCKSLRIEEIFNYVNGIKEGPAATFYPDVCDPDKGMKLSGSYKNGKREGLWVLYNKEGSDDKHIQKVINYVNDQVTGKHDDYTSGRKVTFEYTLSEDETELPSVYSDGQILAKKFDGYVEFYYRVSQGRQPIKQRKYYNEKGVPTGLWTNYYPNGQIKEHHTPNGLEVFGPNGKLRKKEYYLASWRKTRDRDGGMIKTLYGKNGELKSMALSFDRGRNWTVGFHPNGAFEAIYIKEPKLTWNHHDDGSIRSEYTYTKKGKLKIKYYDKGKKQPTNPPAWQSKALENPDSYTREQLKVFFELIENTRKAHN